MAKKLTGYRPDGCLIEDVPSLAPELRADDGLNLPERVDLRAFCSPVEDQGTIGSCAANAVVGALEYHQRLARQPATDLSRLFVYYNSRRLADKENEDSGTFIHHVMASVLAYGACPENMWPYQPSAWSTKPTDACYAAANGFGAVSYARTPLGASCKAAVAAGLPVVFGISLPFEMLMLEAGATGEIQRPTSGQWPTPSGGHAMLIVGYDDTIGKWLVRNSWGADWGNAGHVLIDYDVMAHYSHPHAYWTIGAIEQRAGLSLTGPTPAAAADLTKSQASSQVANALAQLKQQIGADLKSNLDTTRQSIRDRLRGPGAGGGY